MEVQINRLNRSIAEKQGVLAEKERERKASWSMWDASLRELSVIEIKEIREDLFEMKRQLGSALGSTQDPFGQRRMSEMRMEAIHNAPLQKKDVSFRSGPGGGKVCYLETHHVIEAARDIFGFDYAIEIRSPPSILFQQAKEGKHIVCMQSIVRVSLSNGCFHEDVGVSSITNSDVAEAIKVASKSCVSDGIKRTLKHFGPAFGSCIKEWTLYKKRFRIDAEALELERELLRIEGNFKK